MTLASWLWIALSVFAAIVFAALIWFGGPLVFIGDAQPLEGVWTRLSIIFVIWLIVFGAIAWRVWSRRRAAAKLQKAMTETVADESDAPVLKGKMEDALATLRRSSKSPSRALYDLPWYLIIGPPGAGEDDGAGQLGAQVSARRRQRGAGGARGSAARATATGGSPTRRC